MSQRQARRARCKADAPATRQSSRRQRPGGKRNGSKTGPANPAPKQTPRQQGRAAEGKDPAENEYSPAAEIVAAGNKTGRSTKAGQPTEKAGRWRKGRPAGSNADRLTENRPTDRKETGRRRSGNDKKQGDAARRLHLPFYVIPERFERSTRSLEGCCSIQLSYWRIRTSLKCLNIVPHLLKKCKCFFRFFQLFYLPGCAALTASVFLV